MISRESMNNNSKTTEKSTRDQTIETTPKKRKRLQNDVIATHVYVQSQTLLNFVKTQINIRLSNE